MGLNKITKPKWATGAPSYAVEPSESKKTVGWKAQEKPPYQWMNWLFLKAYQWFGWGEERTEFSDSASFHTTGASVTWSGTQIIVPAGGLYLEWRSRNTIVNNILPEATYSLADGEYLVFIPHATPGTVLATGDYATLVPGRYAIVAGAALIDNVTYTEIIVFKRRGGILEVPLFKTAVQAGGALASNDLLIHSHQDADDGGKLDHGLAMDGLGDDDHPQYAHLTKAGQSFSEVISGQTPTLAGHLATKAYVDGVIPDLSHVCYDNTAETISESWIFNEVVSGQTPTLAAHLATKGYVDGLIPDMSHVVQDNTTETITQEWNFTTNPKLSSLNPPTSNEKATSQSMAKAWGFTIGTDDGGNLLSFAEGYNVATALDDLGDNQRRVTFLRPFANVNYTIVADISLIQDSVPISRYVRIHNKLVGSFEFKVTDDGTNGYTDKCCSFVVYGTLSNA